MSIVINNRTFIEVDNNKSNNFYTPDKFALHEMITPSCVEYYVKGVCVEPFSSKRVINSEELNYILENKPEYIGDKKFYVSHGEGLKVYDPSTEELTNISCDEEELIWMRNVFAINY